MTAAEAIETCNEFIWHCLFPASSGFHVQFGSHQHTCIIRTFLAGMMVFHVKHGFGEPCFLSLLAELCDPDWQPDDRFRPTSHASN